MSDYQYINNNMERVEKDVNDLKKEMRDMASRLLETVGRLARHEGECLLRYESINSKLETSKKLMWAILCSLLSCLVAIGASLLTGG